jgi:hypothetical protein
MTKGLKWTAIGLAAVAVFAAAAWWYTGLRARSALLAQPVYQVLEKHRRAVFDELLARYRRYQQGEIGREEFTNFANARISDVATRSLAQGSQESVLALVTDMVATARKLQANSAESCFRFWFPEVSGPPAVANLIDAEAQAHTLSLMSEVIRSAAENPAPLPGTAEVQDDLARVINATYEQFGADAQMLAHAKDPRVDRGRVCEIAISLYERILKLPPAQASALLRVMTQTG